MNELATTGDDAREIVQVHTGGVMLQGYEDQAVRNIETIRHLHSRVMREGIDYGVIPGAGGKPTLLKPGAETLLATFGLSALKAEIQAIPIEHHIIGHVEYLVTIDIVNRATGEKVGFGTGSASTMESKHRWRKGERACPNCGAAAIIKGKAEYGGGWLCWKNKGGCNSKFQDGDQAIEGQSADRSENTDPADQRNTVLKMAKKRALVDAALTTCAASGIFTQDVEDMPEFQQQPRRDYPPVTAPKAQQRKPDLSNRQPHVPPGQYPDDSQIDNLAPPVESFGLDDASREVNGDQRERIRILAIYGSRIDRETQNEIPFISKKDGSPYRRFRILRHATGETIYAMRWHCDWGAEHIEDTREFLATVTQDGVDDKGEPKYSLHGLVAVGDE